MRAHKVRCSAGLMQFGLRGLLPGEYPDCYGHGNVSATDTVRSSGLVRIGKSMRSSVVAGTDGQQSLLQIDRLRWSR